MAKIKDIMREWFYMIGCMRAIKEATQWDRQCEEERRQWEDRIVKEYGSIDAFWEERRIVWDKLLEQEKERERKEKEERERELDEIRKRQVAYGILRSALNRGDEDKINQARERCERLGMFD